MSLVHIIVRAQERYGLLLTKEAIRYIIKLIISGRAEAVDGPIKGHTWRVKYDGIMLAVGTMHDRFGKLHINTVLPESYAKDGFSLAQVMTKKTKREKRK